MNTPSINMFAGALCLLSSLCLNAVAFAGTEMSAGDRAKMAKERAKTSAAFGNANSKNGENADEGTPCSLDIGNVDTGGRGRAPREVNVFITGDVIQANRNCR